MRPYQISIHGFRLRIIQKSVLHLFAVLVLFACDQSVQLKINETRTFTLDNSCGTIEFHGSAFSRSVNLKQYFSEGKYELNLEALEVLIVPATAGSVEQLKFYDTTGIEISDHTLLVNSGDRVNMEIILDRPVYTIEGNLLILPSSYLTCNQQPLTTDTLRIYLTNQ